MSRFRLALHALALTGLCLGRGPACAEGTGLAIEEFVYVDTSGEPVDQSAVHRQRLEAFMTALRRDLVADTRYRLVPSSCRPPCSDDMQMSADLLHAASEAGAKILIVGGIHKLSTLVQNAKVTAIDVDANRVVYNKLFTFRGDNDDAWNRAEVFVSRDIHEALAAYAPARGETK
jgi:hypothetical protein